MLRGAIICTAHAKGRVHDFRLFKQSRLPLSSKTQVLADKGYQGILKLHPNSQTPKKKPKKAALTKADRRYNCDLARRRVIAEHVNRRLKIGAHLGRALPQPPSSLWLAF